MTPWAYRRLAAQLRTVALCQQNLSPAVYAGAMLHAAETLEAWSFGQEPDVAVIARRASRGLRLFGDGGAHKTKVGR